MRSWRAMPSTRGSYSSATHANMAWHPRDTLEVPCCDSNDGKDKDFHSAPLMVSRGDPSHYEASLERDAS